MPLTAGAATRDISPGKPTALYGYPLEIKRLAPCRAFIVSLVNGDLQGYIVTPQAAAAGGYEATNAVFAPAAGSVLVNAALRTAERIAAKDGHERTQRTPVHKEESR